MTNITNNSTSNIHQTNYHPPNQLCCAKQRYTELSYIKVNKLGCLMRYVAAKITADKAMPSILGNRLKQI